LPARGLHAYGAAFVRVPEAVFEMSVLRQLAVAAVSLMLAALPAAAAEPALTPEQADAVNKLIHDYLMSNPKVLTEALDHADAAAKADAEKASKTALVDRREELEKDPTSPVLGNPNGDVTIVEFFDYRCPYCKASAPVIADLLAQDKKVRLVLKDFPLLGKESVYASRVALVAQNHGKYAEFHKAMFALKTPVNDAATLDVAKSIGLDPAVVKKEVEAPDIDAILRHNFDLGKAIGAEGTPAFVIGDAVSPGAMTLEDFKTQIAAARAKLKS
jgi:protein-disulfide isomerase